MKILIIILFVFSSLMGCSRSNQELVDNLTNPDTGTTPDSDTDPDGDSVTDPDGDTDTNAGTNPGSSLGDGGGEDDDSDEVVDTPVPFAPFLLQFGQESSPRSPSPINNFSSDFCYDSAIDDSGVYCTGRTLSGHVGDTNGGLSDILVVKFSLEGELLWVKQLGKNSPEIDDSSKNDECHSIAVYGDYVYCGGYSGGNLAGENSSEDYDAVVVKMNKSDGEIIYVKQVTDVDVGKNNSQGDEIVTDIFVDASGIYCSGSTTSNFGETNSSTSSGPSHDVFLMKLVEDNSDPENIAVSVDWITQIGAVQELSNGGRGAEAASNYDVCEGISVYGDYVYCVGYTQGELGDTNPSIDDDILLLKVAKSDGAVAWIEQLGESFSTSASVDSSGRDEVTSIFVNASGIFIGGSTYGSFGETNAGQNDVLLMKLTEESDGSLSNVAGWVTQIGSETSSTKGFNSSNRDNCNNIFLDSTHIYCAGWTISSLGTANFGAWDAVVIKIDQSDGDVEWIKHINNKEDSEFSDGVADNTEYCYGVVANDDHVFCMGYTLSSIFEESYLGYDIFFAKLSKSDPATGVLEGTQLGKETYIENQGSYLSAGLNDMCHATFVDETYIYCAGESHGFWGDIPGGSRDVLVMKILKSDKSIVWLKQLGDSMGGASLESQACYAIAVDDTAVYCSGETKGDFGEVGVGDYDAFVLKLSKENGELEWIKQFGSTFLPGPTSGTDICEGLAVDDSAIYCAGGTTRDFGTGSGGNGDAMLMKLSKVDGEVIWYNQLGTTFDAEFGAGKSSGGDWFQSIAIDEHGIVCGGYTTGSMEETNAGSSDPLIVRFSKTDGSIDWVKQIGEESLSSKYSDVTDAGSGHEYCQTIALDGDKIYCGGYTTANLSEVTNGGWDVYVLKLLENREDPSTPTVSVEWLIQHGSASDDACEGIAVDDSGVYCAGITEGLLGDESFGGEDAFVMKVVDANSSSPMESPIINQLGSPGDEHCTSIALDIDGIYCGGYTDSDFAEIGAGNNDIFIWALNK